MGGRPARGARVGRHSALILGLAEEHLRRALRGVDVGLPRGAPVGLADVRLRGGGALLARGERVDDAEVNGYWSASGAVFAPNAPRAEAWKGPPGPTAAAARPVRKTTDA